jgi:hypothetical protein
VVGGTTRVVEHLDVTDHPAAMEPTASRRDDPWPPYMNKSQYSWPQWSPPVIDGTTGPDVALEEQQVVAAMEPAGDRRDDGSQFLSRVTCASPRCREKLSCKAAEASLDGVVNLRIEPLTCVRARPGLGVTAWALAWSD